ncbi:hypothetical protein MPLDJ20_120051 [Mesorhizobium plurifarium]|uniref:Uncharacterized protein n=1 Tax=Mesorhizobium plurifarium TaxID=69974 RepID=A0A090E4X9_MESPL|nr:hypothetical protein MPLDJ20_120051 [Mesorhizobium plurifarium]
MGTDAGARTLLRLAIRHLSRSARRGAADRRRHRLAHLGCVDIQVRPGLQMAASCASGAHVL